jgi:outer membrane immunogenic protein
LVATAVAMPVHAADMAPPPAYYPPPVYRPAVYDWTGIYIGAHIGGGMLADTVTYTTTTVLEPAGATTDVHPWGVVGGGQAGVNYQFAPWVIGIEGAWSASGISGSPSISTLTPPFIQQSTSKPTWFGTATARAGYAFNTLLLYVKGGAAWERVEYYQNTLTPGVAATQSIIDTRNGFVAGGGVEYGMTENLSAKFEYQFFDFGTKNYVFNPTPLIGGVVTPIVLPVGIQSEAHIFTVGLNYRFNWVGGWH